MINIDFVTKEENNRRREAEFLTLSPAERLQSFLRSFDSDLFSQFVDPKELGENKGNFCIYKNAKDESRTSQFIYSFTFAP